MALKIYMNSLKRKQRTTQIYEMKIFINVNVGE